MRAAAPEEGYPRRADRADRPAELRREPPVQDGARGHRDCARAQHTDTSDAGEAPAQAADDTVKPAADAALASTPKRRRAKRAT